MLNNLFEEWCEHRHINVADGRKLYLLKEKDGARPTIEKKLDDTVASHYEEPKRLADCIARRGYVKAAQLLNEMLPQTKKARSGDLGEILATEAVSAFLNPFQIPIKRLRWRDGRESAMRGEDLIGIAQEHGRVRFLKGESKSRSNLTPSVLIEARKALKTNDGRPTQHTMGFVMNRLLDQGQEDLALVFEDYMLIKTIALQDLIHLIFTLSGNNASVNLESDLRNCDDSIEQHSIALCIPDHQNFIASIYERLKNYAPQR